MTPSFEEYLNEKQESILLNEVLIQFGKTKDTKFNQIVIMAGGAGSGKGFIKNNVMDIDGITFDVDKLKKLAMKSKLIKSNIKKEFGVELDDLNLRTPGDVSKLHHIIKQIGLSDRKTNAIYASIIQADENRKPNLIFDVTMKTTSVLIEINKMASDLGYLKENIHIVWVLNDLETALKQNAKRPRVVEDDILIDTHNHVSFQMQSILRKMINIQKYMDGLFYIAFNKQFVNSTVKKGNSVKTPFGISTPMFVENMEYVKIKDKLKPINHISEIEDEIYQKIISLVPNKEIWNR